MAMRNLTAGEEMVERAQFLLNAKAARAEAERTGIKPMTDWIALAGDGALEGNKGDLYHRYAKCMDGTYEFFTAIYIADHDGPNKWFAWTWRAEYKDYPIENYREMLLDNDPFEGAGWSIDDYNSNKYQIATYLNTPEKWAFLPEIVDVFYEYYKALEEHLPWTDIGVKDIYGNNPEDSRFCYAPLEDIKAYAEKIGVDLNFRLRKDHDDFSAFERAYPEEAKYLD